MINLFSWISALQGIPIGQARQELKRLQALPVSDFIDDQEKRKWRIFNYHFEHNPVYRSVIGNKTISTWDDIPILQKSDFQKPLNELLSSNFTRKDVYINNTSGSTGKPFYFAKDRFAHAMTWAYIMERYKELGINYGSSLQARFFGIPLSSSKYFKEKFKDFVSARVRFPIFDLSDKVLERYYHKFKTLRFNYIYGYTSSLYLFAKYINTMGKSLKEICPSLKLCIVTSEVCSKEDEVILQKSFGVPVFNEYGAAELDIIGFETNKKHWKLNEENLFIEIVGEDGRQIEVENDGLVVVTSLYNRAMPFIRYNLGDVISLMPQRVGQHRLIKTIQGRINDVALLPSGKKSPGLTFYYISKGLMEQNGSLKEFIIKQHTMDLFHFEYVADHELSWEQQQQVKQLMDEYLEPGLQATFEKVDKIERTRAGKFKHFQSFVNTTN